MKDLEHNNICTFIGACVEIHKFILVYEYCSRGSLMVYIVNFYFYMQFM